MGHRRVTQLHVSCTPLIELDVRFSRILCGAPHNAEDFKQGAKTQGMSSVVRDQSALCLKFRCAKPLEQPSSYVF